MSVAQGLLHPKRKSRAVHPVLLRISCRRCRRRCHPYATLPPSAIPENEKRLQSANIHRQFVETASIQIRVKC